MLEVQKWLKANNGQFDLLEKQLGIKSTFHETDERVILNYSMIDSPKQHPIVQECRALTLNKNTFELVARAFPRFFNAGEMLELHSQFVWEGCTAADKEDGSLALTYMYNGEPHMNTRGSFGHGAINNLDISWRMLFEMAVPNWKEIVELSSDFYNNTLVWELCSRYNKVVRDYEKPTAYLLSAYQFDKELSSQTVDDFAKWAKVLRPKSYTFNSLDEVMNHVSKVSGNDPTYEGLVIRDRNGMRMKVKSDRYCALHRLANNGNVAHPKNIIPLIIDGEIDEILVYFKELEPTIRKYEARLNELKTQVDNIWYCWHDCQKQADFAKEALTSPLSSLLFRARKNGGHPFDYIKDSQELIIKVLS
jgi:RNA ligase